MDTKSEATKHRMSGIGRNPPPSPPRTGTSRPGHIRIIIKKIG